MRLQSKDLTPILLVVLTACGGGVFNPLGGDNMKHGRTAATRPAVEEQLPVRQEAVGVPLPGMVAETPASPDKAFTGKLVAVDSRGFPASADRVFSAVIDAMTALNFPVRRVDSPNGIISTEWIFQNADRTTITLQKGKRITVRYRLLVRVLRGPQPDRTTVEIRTLGQIRKNRKWSATRLKRQVSLELFDAVGEQLVRTTPKTGGALIRR